MSKLECPSETTDINKGIINSIKNFFNNKSEVVCYYQKYKSNYTLSRNKILIENIIKSTKINDANVNNSLLFIPIATTDNFLTDHLYIIIPYAKKNKYKYLFMDINKTVFIGDLKDKIKTINNINYIDLDNIELNKPDFKQKYLKYKQKYLQLKKKLNQI